MVKFIYSGRLKDLADKSDLLLVAADKYDIKDLKELCCQHLAANLNTDQVEELSIYSRVEMFCADCGYSHSGGHTQGH